MPASHLSNDHSRADKLSCEPLSVNEPTPLLLGAVSLAINRELRCGASTFGASCRRNDIRERCSADHSNGANPRGQMCTPEALQCLSNTILFVSRTAQSLWLPAPNGIRDLGCSIRYDLTEADQALVGYAGGRG